MTISLFDGSNSAVVSFPAYRENKDKDDWKNNGKFLILQINREKIVVWGRTKDEYAIPIHETIKNYCFKNEVDLKIKTPVADYILKRSYFDSYDYSDAIMNRGFKLLKISEFEEITRDKSSTPGMKNKMDNKDNEKKRVDKKIKYLEDNSTVNEIIHKRLDEPLKEISRDISKLLNNSDTKNSLEEEIIRNAIRKSIEKLSYTPNFGDNFPPIKVIAQGDFKDFEDEIINQIKQ